MAVIIILNFGFSRKGLLHALGVPLSKIPEKRWQISNPFRYELPAADRGTLYGSGTTGLRPPTTIIEKIFLYRSEAISCSNPWSGRPIPEMARLNEPDSKIYIQGHGLPGRSCIFVDESCHNQSSSLKSWFKDSIAREDDQAVPVSVVADIICKSLLQPYPNLKVTMLTCSAAAPKTQDNCLYNSTAGNLSTEFVKRGVKNARISASLHVIAEFHIPVPASAAPFGIVPYYPQYASRTAEGTALVRKWNSATDITGDMARVFKLVYSIDSGKQRVERKAYTDDHQKITHPVNFFVEIEKLRIINLTLAKMEKIYGAVGPGRSIYNLIFSQMISDCALIFDKGALLRAVLNFTKNAHLLSLQAISSKKTMNAFSLNTEDERFLKLYIPIISQTLVDLYAQTTSEAKRPEASHWLEVFYDEVFPEMEPAPAEQARLLDSIVSRKRAETLAHAEVALNEFATSPLNSRVFDIMTEEALNNYWTPGDSLCTAVILKNQNQKERIQKKIMTSFDTPKANRLITFLGIQNSLQGAQSSVVAGSGAGAASSTGGSAAASS